MVPYGITRSNNDEIFDKIFAFSTTPIQTHELTTVINAKDVAPFHYNENDIYFHNVDNNL